jgi:chromosomal replication initiator protein
VSRVVADAHMTVSKSIGAVSAAGAAAIRAPEPSPLEVPPRSLPEIWHALQESLRSRVQPEQFETWFRRANLVRIDDQTVQLAVQNGFARDWLENYYREKLEAAVREVLQSARRVEIVVDPETCLARAPERLGERLEADSSAAQDTGRGSSDFASATRDANDTSSLSHSTSGSSSGDDRSRGDARGRSARRTTSTEGRPENHRGIRAESRAGERESGARGAYSAAAAHGTPGINGLLGTSDLNLNPKYTFDNFVVGPCNRFAHAAAVGAAEAPGKNYNPFFLHGSVGLGKTHLLQSLCFALLERNPKTRILYLSCETFVNHFISALENGDLQKFRHKYRNVDVLVVDDIHVLANKDRTQEEFFHTFNTLYQAGKQIVLSSDSPPKDIPTLQERLVSRFKWGLVTEIEPPCYETRMAILKRKSREKGREIPDDVACLLAERIDSNIRELEGAVTKLIGFAGVACLPVSCDLAREALRDIFETRKGQPSMEDILTLVCERFDVKISELQSKKRTNAIAYPRQIAMYLARQITRHSLEEIGGFFGGRDHSTVIYAVEKIAQLATENAECRQALDALLGKLKVPPA